MSRIRVAAAMGARELVRQPVLVVLLVALPAYLVGVFTFVAPQTSTSFQTSDGTSVTAPLSELLPVVTAPMAAALLGGIVGLFLVQLTADADRRLVVVGYRPAQIVTARLILLVGVGAMGSVTALAATSFAVAPTQPVWFAAAILQTSLVYAMVGMLLGMLVNRLIGVYAILFGSLIDLFLFQNPLATEHPVGAQLMPGHHPLRAAVDASFTSSRPTAPLLAGLVVLAIAATITTLVVHHRTRPG